MFLRLYTIATLQALLALISCGLAHPGEKHDELEAWEGAEARHAIADINNAALSECSGEAGVFARKERAMKRRMETFRRLQKQRGITDGMTIRETSGPCSPGGPSLIISREARVVHRRNNVQFAKWGQASHDKTSSLKFTKTTPHLEVFGANTTCIMTPDNIIGPYFVLGEQIRSDVVEGRKGVPVHLEVQFIDTQICKPVQGLLIDLWQCDATGIYSGVSAAGQGGLKTTFLHGAQVTDKDGVVEFDTIFPGHYQGRANHQHISSHTGATLLPNNTYSGGTVSHISQLFFDQALISAVEKLVPYNTNRVALTTNAADLYTGYAATAAYDPFVGICDAR